MVNTDLIISKTIPLAAYAGAEGSIQIDTARKKACYLVGVRIVVASGSATTYQLRLGESATWTDDDIDEFYTGNLTAVGTRTNEVLAQPTPFVADANGLIYYRLDVDAGADNVVAIKLHFKTAVGA